MEGHLNLIRTDFKEVEKRILPRFPFVYLIFRDSSSNKVFEVKDISYTGMQLSLKDGTHDFLPGNAFAGELHWRGNILKVEGTVKWVKSARLGVAFNYTPSFEKEIHSFLSISNIITGMRPLHQNSVGMELPSNLKYWLRADGPVELFVWRHNGAELARFQFVLFHSFVEWEDGRGVRTGKILTKRNMDTPLIAEDELVFQLDDGIDFEKINFAKNIVLHIPEDFLPSSAIDFLKLKLGV